MQLLPLVIQHSCPTSALVDTGPADEPAPSHAQLTAQAAQGHLTRTLHTLLTALQPQQQPRVAAVHPGDVVAALAWFVPEGVLETGVQQDAAEALGVRRGLCWQEEQHETFAGAGGVLQQLQWWYNSLSTMFDVGS